MIIRKLIEGKIVVAILGCVMLYSCSVQRNTLNIDYGEKSDAEYYAAFTEATKYALIGKYQNAVGLYNLCIKKYPEKSASYYQLSNIYFSFHDLKKAKYYGVQAVKRDDSNKWYLLHLANIYQEEKNIDSVIVLYEKVIKLTDNPEYKYNLSVFYSQAGDVKKSMKLVKDLENEIPDSKEILRLKHMNYSALHMPDSAIYQLKKLIKLFPSDMENYGLLAEYLSEINRNKEASEVYKEMLEKDPENGLANFSYGDFYLKQGEKDSALYFYKRGFTANEISIEDKIGVVFNFLYDPVYISSDTVFIVSLLDILKQEYSNDPRPFTLSAEFYVKQQKYDVALNNLQKAIDMDVDSYKVWEQYLMLSNYTGNNNNIKKYYETAIKKFPNRVNLFIYAGYGLYELKDVERLIPVCFKGLKIDKIETQDKVQLMNLLADAYRWEKDYVKSDSLFEAILDIDNNNLIVRNNYAYYLALRGESLEKAVELSKFTINKEPENSTFLDTYGWVLFVSGDYKGALKYIERAIKNGGNRNPEILDHYGEILLKLNQCEQAIEAWNYALKYSNSSEKYKNKIVNAQEICK